MTRAPARHGLAIAALALAANAAPPAPPLANVTIAVEAMRSHKGQVLACLTNNPHAFPDCSKDAAAHRLVVPATQAQIIDFGPVPPGTYAVSLLHDENGNGHADMALLIPKEGFGFSRNPAIAFGPPRFGRAAFVVGDAPVSHTIRMRYMF